MPIIERDPWREQYFEGVSCPADVMIPTDDPDCWVLYPHHRWVYDKLRVAQTQGLPCGPHGVPPDAYPVFSKPNFNLKGMGVGSAVIADAADMALHSQPGHMWMQLLTGEHVSSDCAIVNGTLQWARHATGESAGEGTFALWTIEARARLELERFLAAWTENHLGDYTGMLNFETIGGKIIEVHLRFADQWPDLYGAGWVEALIGLYQRGQWNFTDGQRQTGYSLPLFARHGFNPKPIADALLRNIKTRAGISSLQITFHRDKKPELHAMPPGGFRLAIVNATDLKAGREARDELAAAFGL